MGFWKAHLDGDPTDLTMLAEGLVHPACKITRGPNGFFMTSDRFESLSEAADVRARASEIAAVLSGASMTLLGTPRPILVTGIGEVRDDGSENTYIFPDSAVIRLRALPASLIVTHPDGTVEKSHPADPLNQWLEAAIKDLAVARALRIRARGPLDWDDLLRVIEIVQAGASGRPFAFAGAPSKKEIELVSHTANSVHVLDDRARHPGKDFAAPPIPCSLPDAQSIVDRLLESWLRSAPS